MNMIPNEKFRPQGKSPWIELAIQPDGTILLNGGPIKENPNCLARLRRGNSILEFKGIDTAVMLALAKIFGWPGARGLFSCLPNGLTAMKLQDNQVIDDSEAFQLSVALERHQEKNNDPNNPISLSIKQLANFAAAGRFTVHLSCDTSEDSEQGIEQGSTQAPSASTPSYHSLQRWPNFTWLITIAMVVACIICMGHFRNPHARIREFYAWEKTPQGQYKQVRKNYFMNEALCKNVIDVLNNMSTTQPRSNWILSHTTDSTFESWPADTPPSPRLQEFSTYGD